MSKRNVLGWVVGVAWITSVVTFAETFVGKTDCTCITYHWYTPWQLAIVIFVPFLAGLLAAEKKG